MLKPIQYQQDVRALGRVAHNAHPPHAVGVLTQADADLDVQLVQELPADCPSGDAWRSHNGDHRRHAMSAVGELLQAHCFEARAERRGVQAVPSEARLETFFDRDLKRLAQRVELQDGRGVVINVLRPPQSRVQAQVEIPALNGRSSRCATIT